MNGSHWAARPTKSSHRDDRARFGGRGGGRRGSGILLDSEMGEFEELDSDGRGLSGRKHGSNEPLYALNNFSASRLFNGLFGTARSISGDFSRFLASVVRQLHSGVQRRVTRDKECPKKLWPMPIPFPWIWGVRAVNYPSGIWSRSFCKHLNFTVCILNWLRLRRPNRAPFAACIGTLSSPQAQCLERLASLSFPWDSAETITTSDLGRSALKVENVDGILKRLQEVARENHLALDPYQQHWSAPREGVRFAGYAGKDRGTVVIGRLKGSSLEVGGSIDCDRLKFWEVPRFDATPFLDSTTLQALDDPQALYRPNPDVPIPQVRFRGTRSSQIKFYHRLDDSNRLALFEEREVDTETLVGGFSVYKDSSWDRLIVDARPPNARRVGLARWIRTLGSSVAILDFRLAVDECLAVFADDLRDFYHMFVVSRKHASLNVFKGKFDPKEFINCRAFHPRFLKCPYVYGGLNTLAMGNLNAVEVAQASHLGIAAIAGAVTDDSILHLDSKPIRGRYGCGIIVDDHLGLQVERGSVDPVTGALTPPASPPEGSEGQVRFDAINEVYAAVGLTPHPDKKTRRSYHYTAWGTDIDGVRGLVRAPVPRVLALAHITVHIVRIGCCTAGLLDVLAGSWIACLIYRRRMMCLLDLIYDGKRGHYPDEILKLSEPLKTELLLIASLAPLAVTDLRATDSDLLLATDASDWGTAVVSAEIPVEAGRELRRHVTRKGQWTRILSSVLHWQRRRGVLDPDLELPGGRLSGSSPLWPSLARGLQFQERSKRRYIGRRPHINIGEVRAIVDAEKLMASERPSTRFIALIDSQVAIGCYSKGRSSSSSLNLELSTGLPDALGGGGSTGLPPIAQLSTTLPTIRHGMFSCADPKRCCPPGGMTCWPEI